MDELDEVRLIVEELHANLDNLPYHVFLGVAEDAVGDELQRAYHERAQVFHPDRFYGFGDEALEEMIYAVFKRITEAYRVLSTPAARAQYQAQRKAGAIRLGPVERSAPARPEDDIADPRARRFYLQGMDAARRGDKKSAKLSLQMALSLEPDSPRIREELTRLS